MKPFGNRKEMDEKELEHYISELRINERNKLRDTILICFLVIGGIVGLFFLLNAKGTTADIWSPNPINETVIAEARISNDYASNVQDKEVGFKPSKDNVVIAGIREAQETVTFTVQNYNKRVDYMIDFGDGIKKRFKSKRIAHRYKKLGSYKVKIYVEDKHNKKKMYYSNLIDIAPSAILSAESAEEFRH